MVDFSNEIRSKTIRFGQKTIRFGQKTIRFGQKLLLILKSDKNEKKNEYYENVIRTKLEEIILYK